MKKFKNIKLMLLGLLTMGSVNAFAAVGDYKTDGTYWYVVEDEAKATVSLVGYSNVAEKDPTSLTIKDEVTLQDDQLKPKPYTVVAAYKKGGGDQKWWEKNGTDEYTQTVDASKVKELIVNMRIDGEGPDASVVNGWDDIITPALTAFTNLETLVVKEAHMIGNLPVLNTLTSLKKINLEGVTNGGNLITLPAGFATSLTLEEIKLPAEPLAIGNYAFAYVKGPNGTDGKPTAVDINISKAETIGTMAFLDTYVTGVTIGADVTKIDADAFAADVPEKAYLETVNWENHKLLNTSDPKLPYIPAVFNGQKNIKTIKISDPNVSLIADGAFAAITGEVAVDLSGAGSLTSIINAFGTDAAAPQFTSLKLADAPLKATNGKTSDVVDLTNSASSLKELELPATVTKMDESEFASFVALESIGLGMEEIPNNAFKDCSKLATLTLQGTVKYIKDFAFAGTSLTSITIPGSVQSIGKSAFAGLVAKNADGSFKPVTLNLTAAASLGSIGESVFADTNISEADFSTTEVYTIPANAFSKTLPFKGNALSKVVLKEGSASKKVSIGNNAFENNEALTTVEYLNQANLSGIGTYAFANTALTKVEIDQTPIKVVPEGAFSLIETLTEVKLNAETEEVGKKAFAGDFTLAKVENLNQNKLKKINEKAFANSALTELNLDAANSLTEIGAEAFSAGYVWNADKKVWEYKAQLETITLPAEDADLDPESDDLEFAKKYKNQIKTIGAGAFLYQNALKTFANFKYTKIETLPEMFSNVEAMYPGTTNQDLATGSFATSPWPGQDQTPYCPEGLTEFELPNVTFEVVKDKDWDEYKYTKFTWKSKDEAARSLKTIDPYALQGLGIKELVIPATVTKFGACVLQGNTALKTVVWMDAAPSPTKLHKYTFRGDSNLEKFFYMTTGALTSGDLTDMHFYWCSKDKLRVYVTKESLKVLEADGYTTANAKYSKLNDEMIDMITFSAFNTADNMYYRTYYNPTYSTWIKASDNLKVYTAQFNGAKVEMVDADIEGGYYKMEAWTGSNDAKSVAIIACANKEVEVEYYALAGNNKSTLKDKYNEMHVTSSDMPASKLSYFFKLGKGSKGIGFYRITTGTFKAGSVYLKAQDAARDIDFLAIGGEETGISTIQENMKDDAPIFNLQGVRVNGNQKGIFIKNGKKFIVK